MKAIEYLEKQEFNYDHFTKLTSYDKQYRTNQTTSKL